MLVVERSSSRELLSNSLRRGGLDVSEAATTQDALRLARWNEVDAAVLDSGVGLQALDALGGRVASVVVDEQPSLASVRRALRLGVWDYCDAPCADVVERVREAVAGRGRLPENALQGLQADLERAVDRVATLRGHPSARPPGLTELSPRECEIVSVLLQGKTAAETADEMNISPHTVRNHMKSIFRKMGVASHLELLALFVRPP